MSILDDIEERLTQLENIIEDESLPGEVLRKMDDRTLKEFLEHHVILSPISEDTTYVITLDDTGNFILRSYSGDIDDVKNQRARLLDRSILLESPIEMFVDKCQFYHKKSKEYI